MYAAKTGAKINPQAGIGNKHINQGRLCSVCLFSMKMLGWNYSIKYWGKEKVGNRNKVGGMK